MHLATSCPFDRAGERLPSTRAGEQQPFLRKQESIPGTVAWRRAIRSPARGGQWAWRWLRRGQLPPCPFESRNPRQGRLPSTRAGEQQPFLRKQESIPGARERPGPTSPLWVPACAGTTTPHRLSCESRNPSLGRGRGPSPPPPSGYPLARARRHPTVFPAKAGIHPWGAGEARPHLPPLGTRVRGHDDTPPSFLRKQESGTAAGGRPPPFASFDRLRTNGTLPPYRNRSDAASLIRGPVPDSSEGV